MILIIDIDETLIHSRKNTPSSLLIRDYNLQVNDVFDVFNYGVQKRPYVDEFLSHILNDDYYEAGIWSAGTHEYVHKIVDELIPDKSKLKFILTRNDCDELDCKPLTKVRNLLSQESNHLYKRTVHDFLIIDNKKGVTGFDHLNHLEIIDFEGDKDDIELQRLWKFLDTHRYYSSEYLTAHWK